MSRKWPEDTVFKTVNLQINESSCNSCGSRLYKSKNRDRKIYTFDGALLLKRERAKCSNRMCDRFNRWFVPREEELLTMPRWKIGWDIFSWIGFRRYKRHWSVPQIRDELLDGYDILLSDDSIEDYLRKYQNMVAAKHQDLKSLKELYAGVNEVDLTIDGLQPEKGHETLYVVRDLTKQIIWFAEPLISSSNEEVRDLFKRAKTQCEELGLTVRSWMSDKQAAFLFGIKNEFPKSIHRYCQNHFIRDLADSMSDIDSKAKVQMRKKVRGLRTLEKAILASVRSEELKQNEANVVLDYCTVIKGVLNDNKGGPLNPTGYRMYNALQEVYDSLGSNLIIEGETRIDEHLESLQDCIEQGMEMYEKPKVKILKLLDSIKKVNQLLDPSKGSAKTRQASFHRLALQYKKKNSNFKKMGKLMISFEDGLFAGGDVASLPVDNLDLERWFRNPKGHQRRIHGRKHAGTKIVYEGPTLLPTLDAHLTIERPLKREELIEFVLACPPESEIAGLQRKKKMSQACSKKKDLSC
jgi:hypothetical protein